VRSVRKQAWLLVLLSAGLQILIFPLPNFYFLGWIALAPLLIALLQARHPATLQLSEGAKRLPARPWQAFLMSYLCGVLWYAGTCYWIYPTMHHFGGINSFVAFGILLLFALYLGLYHGVFGMLISLLAGQDSLSRRALLLAPLAWVAVELARTRISGFPWDLLGVTQVDNIPLSRIASVTGVYGLSLEIMVVNVAFAAALLVRRDKRKPLLLMALGAAAVLQAGRLIPTPAELTDHTAFLVQANIPILEGADWTTDYFQGTLRDLSLLSLHPPGEKQIHPDLIVWPENPAPFYTTDPAFRETVSGIARQSNTWVLAGSIGVRNASQTPQQATEVYNSAALVSPAGQWTARYDKIHLVPFGEYVPFRRLFSFAAGLTEQVGEFMVGTSRAPLQEDGAQLGVFICYESIFPDEIRQFPLHGAQVLVNLSNDGWYGDSGAYAQHLEQARMRAIENHRWLLRATNTGVTASIDPNGRVVARAERKLRTVLAAPYALSNVTTFYTRHGDWFAWLCAIILLGALITRLPFLARAKR
jgi:apolipoprotein N-acyltransferase